MTMVIRQYTAITLAIMLALTGQAMAVARGASSTTEQMVICSGNGPVTLSVDENGQPTGPAHICPDCALSLLVSIDMEPQFPARPIGRKGTLEFVTSSLVAPQFFVLASARDPPVL